MKLMGVDYGDRRIGIAITDEDGYCVRGLTTIDSQKQEPLAALQSVIAQEMPGVLVFGVPLDINDNETTMSLKIRAFADKLAQDCTLPITFIDESYLSVRAGELLRSRKKRQRRDKASHDRLAACLILERYREEHAIHA
jgi:putative Holliday junction resolvase